MNQHTNLRPTRFLLRNNCIFFNQNGPMVEDLRYFGKFLKKTIIWKIYLFCIFMNNQAVHCSLGYECWRFIFRSQYINLIHMSMIPKYGIYV